MHGFRVQVQAAVTGTKIVKKKRVYSVTRLDGGTQTGIGSGATQSEALAVAVQNLMDELKKPANSNCTWTELTAQKVNATVPVSHVVKAFYKVAEGEAAPGIIVFDGQPIYADAYEGQPPGGPQTCVVEGHMGASGTLTLRWDWGAP